MLLEGSFAVKAPRRRAWEFFLNPEEFLECIDDPHTLQVLDPDHFRGDVRTGVGFIKGTFNWSAHVAERSPPDRGRIKVHGSGMGSAFDIDSTIELSDAGDETTVRWRANVVMNGTLASVGARLMKGTIDKKMGDFFRNAQRRLTGPGST